MGGELTLDTGLGRRIRPLGPLTFAIAVPLETVFNVIAAPYLGRTPRTMAEEIEVLERGSDMVLAAHRTPVGWGMVATHDRDRPASTVPRRLRSGSCGARCPMWWSGSYSTTMAAQHGSTLGELGPDSWQLGRW